MSFGERDKEIASVSVPIFSQKDRILGALTITGHISNFNKKNSIFFLNILRSSKTKIEKKLKFKTKYTIKYGINEIIDYLKKTKLKNKNYYGNYKI